MKNLVIKTFLDKDTQKGYTEGDTYESTDSERVTFLVSEGFLKESSTRKRVVKKDVE